MSVTAMRPRRVGELLDAAIKLYLGNARTLMGLAAAVVIPVQVVIAIVYLSTFTSGSDVPGGSFGIQGADGNGDVPPPVSLGCPRIAGTGVIRTVVGPTNGEVGMSAGEYGKASGPRAGFWRRFGAAFIDGIIVGLVLGILNVLLKGVGYALGIIIAIAYFTYFEGGDTGQTIGKRALGIRVVDFETGGPIGYGRGFIRYIGRIVSGVVIYIGYLWMLWDHEKQTWHDKFAGAVVVPASAYPVGYRAESGAATRSY